MFKKTPTPEFSDSFINHLKSNCPAEIRECLLQELPKRWENEKAAYDSYNKIRAARGQTDVVNYVIEILGPLCAKKK